MTDEMYDVVRPAIEQILDLAPQIGDRRYDATVTRVVERQRRSTLVLMAAVVVLLLGTAAGLWASHSSSAVRVGFGPMSSRPTPSLPADGASAAADTTTPPDEAIVTSVASTSTTIVANMPGSPATETPAYEGGPGLPAVDPVSGSGYHIGDAADPDSTSALPTIDPSWIAVGDADGTVIGYMVQRVPNVNDTAETLKDLDLIYGEDGRTIGRFIDGHPSLQGD